MALAVLVFSVAAGASASIARADGDPASDYLVSRQVFLSSESGSASPAQRELLGLVEAANRAGFAIRVAVISSDYDLGSITALWQKPRLYARFLGLELSQAYKQRLLVVMPDGFGFNWPGHSAGAAYRLLGRVPIRSGSTGSSDAAQTAVRRLAAAAGVAVGSPTRSPAQGTASAHAERSAAGWIIAAAVAALALGVGVVLVLRRRRRVRPEPASPPPVQSEGASRFGPGWVAPGLVVLVVVAVGVPILVVGALHHAGAASGTSVAQVVTPPPVTWPAGRRAAPEFVLRDQRGHRVSPAAFRGRPVIVTFVDPLCRNLCPLEAKVLNAAVDQLPARRRPEILAVSVDVYANADARANLLRDVRKWELVPQWRWAVGAPAQLAITWKRYQIGVSVTTKKIAATTINYITHTEAAFVIDATGHERALFLWPFYPQDVDRTLRQLT